MFNRNNKLNLENEQLVTEVLTLVNAAVEGKLDARQENGQRMTT
ncbi:hypothetical protein [uncultured Methanolobus sp.]|nr:hypothetical protein [uncultured Methanolobus sp.]